MDSNFDIYVKKINEVFMNVKCENRGIELELSDYFSFEVKNWFYKKSPGSLWDGKIRLYNMYDSTLYIGLLNRLISFCNEYDYKINIDFNILSEIESKITFEDIYKKIENQIEKKYTLRYYQKNALTYCIKNKRGIIESPTGSGKSLIIYSILSYFFDSRFLIIVPNTNLVLQMYNDFQEYTTNVNDITKNYYQIYAGQEKENDSRVFISTWQSLYKLPKKFFKKFDGVIVDEVHLATAKSIKSILHKCENAKYRFGFTGTLKESKTDIMLLNGLLGKDKKFVSTKTLMNEEYLSKIKIYNIILNHKNICNQKSKMEYHDEIEYLVNCKKRNKYLYNLINYLNGKTLIFFERIVHGKEMYELTRKKHKNVFYISGEIKGKDRELIRNFIDSNNNNSILFASFRSFQVGANIKKINNVIFSSPSKSKIKVMQSLGRSLRKSEFKTHVNLFDIWDNINNVNHTLNHGKNRYEYYINEGFSCKFLNVKL